MSIYKEIAMSIVRILLITGFLLLGLLSAMTSAAHAGDTGLSAAYSESSQMSANGSAQIVDGSLAAVTGSAEFSVRSVRTVGDVLHVAVKGSAEVGEVVLAIPLAIAGGASYAAGQTITVVAEGMGWLVTQGGKVLAFIPNEAGKGLLHSSVVTRH